MSGLDNTNWTFHVILALVYGLNYTKQIYHMG